MPEHSFQFKNILDLIDPDVLRNFLLGYNHVTLSGISVGFKTCSADPKGPHNIDFIYATSDPDETFANYRYYCRFYRKDCGQDAKCVAFDRRVVMDYYADPNKGPMLYRCHREVWDMAYPLVIEKQLMGVILSGQTIVRNTQEGVSWSNVLKQSYSSVFWGYADSDETHCNQRKDQIAVIENDGNLTDSQKEGLMNMLVDADDDEKTTPVLELDGRFQDFLSFGRITADLLTEQYKSRKLANEFKEHNRQISFQRECIVQLSKEDRLNIRYWQVSLMKSLSMIAEHFQIERAGMFHGRVVYDENSANREISFELVAMNTAKWWRNARSFSLDQKEYPKSDGLYPPGKSPKQIAKIVGEDLARDKYLYVFPYANEATNVYTLIILQNNLQISQSSKGYLKDLLLQICRQDETIRLNLRAEETHDAFTQHVVEVRHDLKTNLQLVVNNVQQCMRLLRTGTPPDSRASTKQFRLVREAVDTHLTAIRKLNWEIRPKKKKKLTPLNVVSAIRQQMSLFEGVANERRVALVMMEDKDLKESILFFDNRQFDRGLQALLDNAIKYSYDNREIKVKCDTRGRKFVFSIENYGIGIPPDQLKDVTKKKRRANVNVGGNERAGEGLGLYIANDIFTKQLGGTLEITSQKSPEVYGETEEYHRYLTTVTVTIPVEILE